MNEENLTLETVNWYDKGNILKFFQKEGYFTNHTVDTLPYSADELRAKYKEVKERQEKREWSEKEKKILEWCKGLCEKLNG